MLLVRILALFRHLRAYHFLAFLRCALLNTLPSKSLVRHTTINLSSRLFRSLVASAMEWLGHAKIEFNHSATSLPLRRRDGETTDLAAVVKESTPPCHLNPILFNGHLQTMWTATKQHGPRIYYKRRVFESDGQYKGTFAVDFVDEPFHEDEADPSLPPRTTYLGEEEFAGMGSDDSRPQLVILHGLSGGSHEIYLRQAIAPLVESGDWEICVVNSRGCAHSKITSGVLYNARATWDVRQVVKWLRKTFPNRPLFGLGFSLGANMLTNYCGEEGDECLFKAAVVCSNPFNLDVANKSLKRTFLGKEVYQRAMGSECFSLILILLRLSFQPMLISPTPGSLKELAHGHRRELSKWTQLDLKRIRNITYLYEFDREVQ